MLVRLVVDSPFSQFFVNASTAIPFTARHSKIYEDFYIFYVLASVLPPFFDRNIQRLGSSPLFNGRREPIASVLCEFVRASLSFFFFPYPH